MEPGRRVQSWRLTLVILGLMLCAAFLLAISTGPTHIQIQEIMRMLLAKLPFIKGSLKTQAGKEEVIIMMLRLPRAVQGALIGAALATAGVVIQSLFKNPMADPFVIGISSGAALGASAAIILGIATTFSLPVLAFLGASLSAFAVYRIARAGSSIPVEGLLLSGIAVAYFLSSITSFLLYSAGEGLHQIIFWLMGGLWASSWRDIAVLLPVLLISLAVLLLFSRDLNALLLGEEPAQHLGIEVEMMKRMILVTASLLAGAAVAFSGTIGFVGLITPHITRLLVGPDHRILLPASALIGAIFLVLSDTIARLVIAPAELPVGVVTAFFGAPFFIYLLKTRRREL